MFPEVSYELQGTMVSYMLMTSALSCRHPGYYKSRNMVTELQRKRTWKKSLRKQTLEQQQRALEKAVWKMWWCAGPVTSSTKAVTGTQMTPRRQAGLLLIDTCFSAYGTFIKIAVFCYFEIKHSNSLCLDHEKLQLVTCVICWEALITGDWISIFFLLW